MLGQENEPPSGFNATGLIASHRCYFADESAMAAASITRVVSAGETRALPPVWVAQPELDDNVPAAITEAFERADLPGARHSFIQQAGTDTDKCVGLMRDFIGRHLSGG